MNSHPAAPILVESLCSSTGPFHSLPSDDRCDPRSSDLDLATCIVRLTTSASRPRIPEPKPTRHRAVNLAGCSGLSQPYYLRR